MAELFAADVVGGWVDVLEGGDAVGGAGVPEGTFATVGGRREW